MEAKDLMIGDWVRYNDIQTKVNYLTEDRIATNDNYVACSEVDSISLTEEILKANGFIANDEYNLRFKLDDILFAVGKRRMAVEYDFTGYETIVFYVQYVHELQHILRYLSNIELADNFKLKEE